MMLGAYPMARPDSTTRTQSPNGTIRNILGGTSAETVTKALYQELENLDKLG